MANFLQMCLKKEFGVKKLLKHYLIDSFIIEIFSSLTSSFVSIAVGLNFD
jgi:hypothetical protein